MQRIEKRKTGKQETTKKGGGKKNGKRRECVIIRVRIALLSRYHDVIITLSSSVII